MESAVFIKGFVVGLLLCAPFGPIGVLALRRTLTEGRLAGLISLLGASTADVFYCALAGLGTHAISVFLTNEKAAFQFLTGLILVIVGIRTSLSRPKNSPIKAHIKGLLSAFTGNFLLVLANPLQLLIFAAIFAALGISGWGADFRSTLCVVTGVFLGSAIWAPIFATGVPHFHLELNKTHFSCLNRLTGTIITAVGIFFAGLGILKLMGVTH